KLGIKMRFRLTQSLIYCRNCSRGNTVLCLRCYGATNHAGHDVITMQNTTDPSIWCGCGDSQYWMSPLRCKFHPPNGNVFSHCDSKIAVGETCYQCRHVFII